MQKSIQSSRPLLPEITDYIAGLTTKQRESIFNEFKDNPACVADFLKRLGEYFLGGRRQRRMGSDLFVKTARTDYAASLPEELKEAEIGFLCYISKGDNVKTLCVWELEL